MHALNLDRTKLRARWSKKFRAARSHFWRCRFEAAARFRSEPGIGVPGRTPEIIVSLTTTPARLPKVHLAIETLLQQSCPPHRLILWLSDAPTPADLPAVLRRQQRRGLDVRFRRDLRSYTKLIYALREHPDSIILTADDDTFYPGDWLRQLHESHLRQPGFIHCQRAHLMRETPAGPLHPYREWEFFSPGQTGPSLPLLPTGVGGVLYPPRVLPAEVFNETIFLKLCPTADDIWFKAMALLAGVPTVKVAPAFREYPTVPGTQRQRLMDINWTEASNDRQIQAVSGHYDLLPLSELRPCFQPGGQLSICGFQAHE